MSATTAMQSLPQRRAAPEENRAVTAEARGLLAGLQAEFKSIPCCFYYDDLGSRYYEQLCEQPEYYLTRTERQIIEDHGDAMAAQTGPCDIVELGCGNGRKTALLLDAHQRAGQLPTFYPIDICEDAISRSTAHLTEMFPSLEVRALAGTYAEGLRALPKTGPRKLFLLLGSSLGNMPDGEIHSLLKMIRAAGKPGDFFLFGADLDKDPQILERAYNDAAGWARRTNLNLLQNVNRQFQADFDTSQFAHLAFHNPARMQVEAHLRSLCKQTVRIAKLGISVHLKLGETIQTQIARKFDLGNLPEIGASAGFSWVSAWSDPKGWYSMPLLRVAT